MERISAVNLSRIFWCCADFGVTLDHLASELGIASVNIERLKAGEDALTFNQLRKIADYLERGVLFFLEPEPVDEVRAHTPQFRTLANQKPELSNKLKALIKRVEKQRDVYLSLREDLDETDRPSFNPPQLQIHNLREAAHAARSWLGLTEINNFESYRKALEGKGILVFQSNGYAGKWQISKENPIIGFALYDTACPVIVVKKQSSNTQQSFTLMHELGHLLLHKMSSIDDDGDIYSRQGMEREVNAFAGYLLVPDLFLAGIRDEDRPADASQYDEWLRQQRSTWGISGEVILLRLLDAGRLKQNQYEEYKKWRKSIVIPERDSGNRWRDREPKHIFGDVFVRTVFDALNARKITLNKASNYLDSLTIKDIHKLEHYYAGL